MPERIGRYQVLRAIGRGGMGVLYHARDAVQGREVALKVMSADTLEDEEARTRFHHEARLAARVQHRNIVKVIESGLDGDVPFIAMEFLRGQTLAERLAGGDPMPLASRLDVVIQVCEGLQCLHEQGIVHRDVKPGNIWLLEDGGVKLLDLGIAKHAGVNLTQHGTVVGSAAYMAPEQLSGAPVDGRADVFSAGVVLYELLSGRKPFQADTLTAVMMKVLHEQPPDIRTLVPGIAEDLAHALDLALQKDPAQRYAEAAELASDLRLARDTGEWPLPAAEPESHVERDDLPLEPTIVTRQRPGGANVAVADPMLRPARDVAPGAPGAPAVPPVSARRRRGLWAGAGLVVVAGAAVILVVAFVRPGAEPRYVLDIRSTPAGADISVDGSPVGERTPAVLTRPARPARIGLTLNGYAPLDEAVAATADPRVSLEYTLRRLLQVHSEPSGARIALEGRDTGLVTPAVVPLDRPYPAAVDLQLEGYEPTRAAVTPDIIDGGAMTVRLIAVAPPRAEPGDDTSPRPLVAVNVSGAYPFLVSGCGVDARASEKHAFNVAAPCTLRLRAPEYFLDVMRSVTARAGGRVELAAPPLANVQLRSRHQDCTLLVNGRAVGSPPVDLEIAAGSYNATLQCPDGQTLQSRTFEIEAGQPIRRIDDYLR
jgi:serine/threonine-protein kinase